MPSFHARAVALILALVAVTGASLVAPAPPAEALGCVLGPSLGSAARAVGISCPQVDSVDETHHWGPAGSACNFGWESGNYPPGFMEFLTATQASRQNWADDEGYRFSWTLYRRAGKTVGGILIQTRPDKSFTMLIDVRGRYGYVLESVYFDCKTSHNGPMYTNSVSSDDAPSTSPLPVIGAPAPPPTAGPLAASGSMSTLGRSNYLLRVDVTNTDTESRPATVELDLAGYAVDGFPTLPRDARCEPAEGLVCDLGTVLPGQTLTTVLILHADGAVDKGETVDLAVSSLWLRPLKANIGSAAVNKPALVFDNYLLTRP
jgi:hypothetical protein